MRFTWDSVKNERNIEKHGVSFEEAAGIWEDPDLMVISAKKKGERRKLAIGRACVCLFTVIFTMRGMQTRIISARRPTNKERSLYEKSRSAGR